MRPRKSGFSRYPDLMSRISSRRVISLAGSPRREVFFRQEAARGFEVFDAFDGRSGAGRDRFDAEYFQRRYGRPPEGGEIGCALSHAALWAAFGYAAGDDDDLMLVAEDDAVFSSAFPGVVRRVARRVVDFAVLAQPGEDPRDNPFWSLDRDLIHLSLFARPVGWPWRWSHRLGAYEGPLCCAGLYLVSRRTARRLVEAIPAEGQGWPADDYAEWEERAGLAVHLLRPTIAGWLGGSEINPVDRPHFHQTHYVASQWGRQAWIRRVSRVRAGARVARHRLRSRRSGVTPRFAEGQR